MTVTTLTITLGPADVARLQLQHLREEHNLGQADLAEIMGISQPRVSDRLSGRSALSVTEIARLADHFGISPAFFFEAPQALPGRRRISRKRTGENFAQSRWTEVSRGWRLAAAA